MPTRSRALTDAITIGRLASPGRLVRAGLVRAAVTLAAPALLAIAMLATAHAPAHAFDGNATEDHVPLTMFKNPKAALRAGLEGVRNGQAHSAVAALQYAAEGGESLAQWKLGKMYASGEGVPQDDVKAFNYFSQIVDGYDEDDADPREAPVVSSAFVALGVYNLTGIANTRITPDPQRALEMFHFAAVNFGDANAQYNLARMYLDGNGIDKDRRQAARWLYLAADKGHVESEAVLGQLLFTGYEGAPPQRAMGLMWLSLAHDGASDKTKDRWIVDLYNKAMASASDADRRAAVAELDDHGRRRN